MSSYSWHMSQVPVILGHLRDSMIPLQATQYDNTRITGSRDPQLPFRLEPMEDADQLWAELIWYAREIAANLTGPTPHALTGAWTNQHGYLIIRPSSDWYAVGEQAHTVTAWLTYHQDDIARVRRADTHAMETALFQHIGRLLAKYRVTPARLRTEAVRCDLCGATAVRAEWAMNRAGHIDQTVQCTVCHQRYEPKETRSADVQAGSETRTPISHNHQTVAT